MTLELWNTFATFGTFLVIAATAIAALVQLRHSRGSNQIAALTELKTESQTLQFEEGAHIVRTDLANKLRDPEFRYQVSHRNARTPENRVYVSKIINVGNLYEQMGLLVKMSLLDRDLALDFWSGEALGVWSRLAPFVALLRREQGDFVWENFEYFIVLSQDWFASNPKGAYPAGVRHVVLDDEWLESDKKYEASRTSQLN